MMSVLYFCTYKKIKRGINREYAIIREIQGEDEQGNIREGDADQDKKRH